MSEYGFFSNQGELSARRLITGICRDIESDLVTRKFALDRLSSGLEKISEKDDGVFERDVFEAIASQLSQSFSMMRYNIITSSELRDHFNLWCKKGSDVSGYPEKISMISSKIEHFNKVLGDIEKSIGVTVSDLEKDSLKIKTPLVVYQWHGETSMVNYIGASFILSSGENHYIDDFLNLATRKVIIEDIAPHKKSSEKSNLIESLACLSSIMKSLNIEFSKINDADRLSFNFENKDGIKMYPLWDGERVSFEQKEETPAVLTNPNELGITEESWTKTR